MTFYLCLSAGAEDEYPTYTGCAYHLDLADERHNRMAKLKQLAVAGAGACITVLTGRGF